MDTRTRARVGVTVVAALATVTLVVLGLWTVYGLAVEYSGGSYGSFADLAFLVVPIPVLAAVTTVVAWPRVSTRTQLGVVLGVAGVMVAGGLAADALGQRENRERLLEGSEHFTCNGPNSEITLPAVIDETWQELPREAPIYGPVQGGRTDCTAAVEGDDARTFADYTETFRDLDGWTVRLDRPQRFVMVRDDVEVTVRRAPDDLTTIRVGVTN
jgi:hypothetical protein